VVLEEDEAAEDHHMKAKIIVALMLLLASPAGVFACAVCSTAPGSKTGKSMAIAIWFLMAAVMTVIGGLGAFSFHLWRHGRMPLEPHHELTEEDLKQYD
jgi:flagellar basal body-associated protein FliL